MDAKLLLLVVQLTNSCFIISFMEESRQKPRCSIRLCKNIAPVESLECKRTSWNYRASRCKTVSSFSTNDASTNHRHASCSYPPLPDRHLRSAGRIFHERGIALDAIFSTRNFKERSTSSPSFLPFDPSYFILFPVLFPSFRSALEIESLSRFPGYF